MSGALSDFRQAVIAGDLETIRLIVLLVREWHEQTGTWPTATEIRVKLGRPGS